MLLQFHSIHRTVLGHFTQVMRLTASVLLTILFAANGRAQTVDTAQLSLSPEEYLNLVRMYHPVAKQADVMVQEAAARVLASRGMFDPFVQISSYEKTFDGTEYYNYNNAELALPTWFGITGFIGLENNEGARLDSETTLGQSSYAGLKLPVLKGLLMDERRAALQQAKIFESQSLADQSLIINDLLFDAMEQYWNWFLSYRSFKILEDVVTVNETRYEALKITVTEGDRPAVDTADALSQLLNFQLLRSDAYLAFINEGYALSNFLWTEETQPYIIPSGLEPPAALLARDPQSLSLMPLEELLTSAQQLHPKLRIFDYKLDYLEVERRLKFQSLLPKLDLKYNALSKGYEFWNQFNNLGFENNYQFGVDFAVPLFLRQGRGAYKSAKLKIRATELDRDFTAVNISNKVRQYHNAMTTQLQQINLAERALEQYQRVLDVELLRYEMGESTIFLVNNRELKVFEAQQKLAELTAKFYKSIYGVQWAAGILQ